MLAVVASLERRYDMVVYAVLPSGKPTQIDRSNAF